MKCTSSSFSATVGVLSFPPLSYVCVNKLARCQTRPHTAVRIRISAALVLSNHTAAAAATVTATCRRIISNRDISRRTHTHTDADGVLQNAVEINSANGDDCAIVKLLVY